MIQAYGHPPLKGNSTRCSGCIFVQTCLVWALSVSYSPLETKVTNTSCLWFVPMKRACVSFLNEAFPRPAEGPGAVRRWHRLCRGCRAGADAVAMLQVVPEAVWVPPAQRGCARGVGPARALCPSPAVFRVVLSQQPPGSWACGHRVAGQRSVTSGSRAWGCPSHGRGRALWSTACLGWPLGIRQEHGSSESRRQPWGQPSCGHKEASGVRGSLCRASDVPRHQSTLAGRQRARCPWPCHEEAPRRRARTERLSSPGVAGVSGVPAWELQPGGERLPVRPPRRQRHDRYQR